MRHIGLWTWHPDAGCIRAVRRRGQPLDSRRVYQDLLVAGQLAAFEVANRFYEIGSPEGLADTEEHLKSRNTPGDSFQDVNTCGTLQD